MENLWQTVEIDNFQINNLARDNSNADENGKKIRCILTENFASTYSGKEMTQSKVPSSINIEDMDAGWISNYAAKKLIRE